MKVPWAKIGAVAVAASALLASALAVAPAASASTNTCADIVFFGARGSGESAATGAGMGTRVAALNNLMRARITAKGMTYYQQYIRYPAADIWNVATPRFWNSLYAGVDAFVSQATDMSVACPNSRFIFAGYSQGAMAAHLAEARLKSANPTLLNKVVGSLLIGDGEMVPRTRAQRFGTAPTDAEGITGSFGFPEHDVVRPASTAEICNFRDIICDYWHAHGIGVHLNSYLSNGAPTRPLVNAANWLSGLIHPVSSPPPPVVTDGVGYGVNPPVNGQTFVWFWSIKLCPSGTDHVRGQELAGTGWSDINTQALDSSGGWEDDTNGDIPVLSTPWVFRFTCEDATNHVLQQYADLTVTPPPAS